MKPENYTTKKIKINKKVLQQLNEVAKETGVNLDDLEPMFYEAGVGLLLSTLQGVEGGQNIFSFYLNGVGKDIRLQTFLATLLIKHVNQSKQKKNESERRIFG